MYTPFDRRRDNSNNLLLVIQEGGLPDSHSLTGPLEHKILTRIVEVWDVLSYLRDRGNPAFYIEPLAEEDHSFRLSFSDREEATMAKMFLG